MPRSTRDDGKEISRITKLSALRENVTSYGQEIAPFSPHSAATLVFMEIRLGQARRSIMHTLWKYFSAGCAGLFALGAVAYADHKPAFCDVDHDHRSHASNYYDYYPADDYYRAGPYRSSGLSFSISIGDDGYDRYDRHDRYDRRDRYDRYDDRRRNGYRGRDGRVVQRKTFNTRFRARIVLTEEIERRGRGHGYGRGRGPDLVCTVEAVGPQRRFVSKIRMRHIAREYCSPRARVRVYA